MEEAVDMARAVEAARAAARVAAERAAEEMAMAAAEIEVAARQVCSSTLKDLKAKHILEVEVEDLLLLEQQVHQIFQED